MVALVAPPRWKCYRQFAVIAGGMIPMYAIARTVDEALPLLREKAERFTGGSLWSDVPPQVHCPATVKALNKYGLLTADRFSLQELTAIAENEMQRHRQHETICGIRAERLQSNLLFLQRKILNHKGNQQ